MPAKSSGMAIASFIFGIASILIPILIPAIIAVVFGHLSRSEIDKSGGRLKGSGMALAGLIMGYASVVVIPFILIIAAIAIPSLLKSRTAANEASAVGSLRAYVTSCVSYSSAHPELGYPANLSLMGPAGDGLLDAVLAPPGGGNSATKSGYNFTYTPGLPDRRGRINTFEISARPMDFNRTGTRSFFADDSGVIRFTIAHQAATVDDVPIM